MVNGPAAVGGKSMLADMLNAPIAKLAMSNDIDAGQNFFNARALR